MPIINGAHHLEVHVAFFYTMGRVSKHKRIKAIDPFYKGPRRDQPREENLPPANPDDDQPVPKSFLRIIRPSSLKPNKKSRQTPSGSHGGSSSKGEMCSQDGKEVPLFKRRRGESLKDYLDRIDIEGKAHLMESFKRSKKTTERRKKYFEKRKRRLQSKKGRKSEQEEVIEFSDLKDDVQFGEVVHAPPRLSAKPRGSEKKVKRTKTPYPLLHKQSEHKEESPPAVVGLKRRQDLEEERERLIREYRRKKKLTVRTNPAKRPQIL